MMCIRNLLPGLLLLLPLAACGPAGTAEPVSFVEFRMEVDHAGLVSTDAEAIAARLRGEE